MAIQFHFGSFEADSKKARIEKIDNPSFIGIQSRGMATTHGHRQVWTAQCQDPFPTMRLQWEPWMVSSTLFLQKHALTLIFLLKAHGKMIMVGAPEKPLTLPVFPLIMGGKILAGSCIGGGKETQEMIDFAGKHNITAEIELIGVDYVNTAMERLAKGDVRYRFVIDVANTLKSAY